MLTKPEPYPQAADRLAYRKDIDGLRAVAVISVVLYHYGATWLRGGFTGVDIFFVISGYLISQRLAGDIPSGRFSILSFYERRVRRILPASAVMVLVTMAAGYFLLLPGDYQQLGLSSAYSLAGIGNFYFYSHTGYFDQAADMLPLLHTWSLGVEEQFYFVWPLLMYGSLKALQRPARVASAIAVVAILSFAYGIYQLGADPKAAFYLPLGRAWELAAGALIVFLPSPNRLLALPLAALGAALTAFSIISVTASDSFPGYLALAPVVGSVLLIYAAPNTFVGKALAVSPMRFTGLISYSLYLWHWPILIFLRHYQNEIEVSWWQAIALTICAYCIAIASWRYVEKPFRGSAGRLVLPVGIATIAAVCAAGALLFRSEGLPSRVPDQVRELSSLEEMWRWECPQSVTLPGMRYPSCAFGRDWHTPGPRAILWGDSHAEHLAPIVQAALTSTGQKYAVLLLTPCPPAIAHKVTREFPGEPDYAKQCAFVYDRAIEAMRNEADIDLVLLSSSWEPLSRKISVAGQPAGASAESIVASGVKEVIDHGKASGRRFVIVTDNPHFDRDPIPCVIGSISGLLRRGCAVMETFDPNKPQSLMTRELTAIGVGRDDVQIIDPTLLLCSEGRCVNTIDGQLIYRDAGHFRRNLPEPVLEKLAHTLTIDQVVK